MEDSDVTLIYLTVALAILQLLDWHTTRTGILSGKAHEANPVAKKLMDIMGMDIFLGVKAYSVSIVGYWIGMQHIYLLAAIVLFYCFIIANNFRAIK